MALSRPMVVSARNEHRAGSKEWTMNSMARRMFELVEPIGLIPYSADEPNETMFALGFTNYWDTYFAGRAAPLGLATAEVVDALFYNFAPGEVARHIPKVWDTTTPEAALAARELGCVRALRKILGDHVDSTAFARATELLLEAATSAPPEGRPMYAALLAIPVPDDVVARLFYAGALLREHRGDGHITALMVEGVGGLEAHALYALGMDMPAEKFGRIHHLPAAQIAAVIDGMRDRGLIGEDGWLSEQGQAVRRRVESLTDDLAAKPYEALEPAELDELMVLLEPLAALLLAAQDF
ncbi:MAG TPA: MarR family transcriptional regulator [Mycobacteriales bacterium]|nr:MarR family transcriptional regulator [Mycobacteriales bacterium]